ncbi:glucose-induced degradation protein 4 [Staphylotrichum tortipilum]|uniref:Glucose-induced degradation protein 4 n=1 Tax=Staphylotrichum tortipilum TaxID=2831512 RepID=A0AAN6MU12_9PEZI|nr:glucose-induced degradation protein 4 [Staphylotrichum longicolle]
MPTPSSNAPNQLSHAFSSCPDLEEAPQLPPLSSGDAPSIHSPPASTWPPHTATYPDGHGGDSRSVTMSPGPQAEGAAHDTMGNEATGPGRLRNDVLEAHKPTDTDEEMSPVADDTVRADGGPVTKVANTKMGEAPSRRKSRPEQLSPVAGELQELDVWGPTGRGPRWVEDSGLVGLGLEYSHMRVIPTPPSLYLQPGSRFVGTQQSERQQYEVEVEIKHVDMRQSFLCGYLKIQGLTDDHPTLTTYFEGEIIGSKYGFITQHQGWGASEKIDISHWSKFTAFRPYVKQARKGGQTLIKDVDQRENIFMRWKEHFLVPDHRVRTINGASFEGFYYICFNQVRGEVSGIYFHSKSEKFQQLELKHVDSKGCYGAMEFR